MTGDDVRGDETVETVADPLPGVIPAYQHTRREVLVRTGVLGAAISLSGLLAACGSSDGPGATPSSGAAGAAGNTEIDHLTWGFVGQTPTGLDLAGTNSIALLIATSLGLEGLLTTDSDLKLRPALAKGWSQPDLLHYVFDIRAGVKFWDGSPLTVEDAIFSIERHLDEEVGSQVGFLVANIKAIEAKSDTRLVITMAKPDPTIPQVLTILPILPKKYVEKVGADLGTPGSTVNMMGTGPFEITSFTTENGVEVRRNKSYWGKAPRVKSASLKFFETPQTMLLAARSGELGSRRLGQGSQLGNGIPQWSQFRDPVVRPRG
jgi:peptide/nickel transport system substrate-binding protein